MNRREVTESWVVLIETTNAPSGWQSLVAAEIRALWAIKDAAERLREGLNTIIADKPRGYAARSVVAEITALLDSDHEEDPDGR